MLNLTINEEANRAMTLYENMLNKTAPVLFEFTNLDTLKKSYCFSPDLSPFPQSYNLIRFKPVTSGPDTNNGEFVVHNTGLYQYKAFEMENQSSTDPEDAVRLIEIGLATIHNDMTQREAYSSNIERITYEKQL